MLDNSQVTGPEGEYAVVSRKEIARTRTGSLESHNSSGILPVESCDICVYRRG